MLLLGSAYTRCSLEVNQTRVRLRESCRYCNLLMTHILVFGGVYRVNGHVCDFNLRLFTLDLACRVIINV